MNNQNLNLIAAIVISLGIMFGWRYFYESPKIQEQAQHHQQYKQTIAKVKTSQQEEDSILFNREDAVIKTPRVAFENENIKGSINLKGLRIDDLSFLKLKETTDPNSANVKLLSPNKTRNAYFAEFGWYSNNKELILPDHDTLWVSDKNYFKVGETVTFSWQSPQNLIFKVTTTLDENYMLSINQEVTNNSGNSISLQTYGIIYKTFDFESSRMAVVHEGAVGVFGEELKEFSYKDVKDKKKISNKLGEINWFGLTEKYWMLTFIPDKNYNYTSNANFFIKNALERYQIDFISPAQILDNGKTINFSHKLYAGIKELELLDMYEEKLDIKLFDRTLDFGWFYIITKPLLNLLHMINLRVGNFGISIMIVTVLVKLCMFNLANKSYRSMRIMKKLQPEIELIKERCGDDKMRMNQEVMALYKNHKVNPLSGCLPIVIQIPVFFSLYKVLNVSIDMRHAPFFGWIKDLSAPDPTNIFNLFGLLPFTPPSFLHIGVWPLLMAVTMFLQQRMSPPASDPVQAQMMKMMPLLFLFMFSGFPAGLLIYWAWNNTLSIVQQAYINYKYEK